MGLLVIVILMVSMVPFALAGPGNGKGPGAEDCQFDGDCPVAKEKIVLLEKIVQVKD